MQSGALPTVFLFAGQGAQYYGMGRELYEKHATFRRCMGHCSELVEKRIGVSIEEIIYAQRADRFEPFDRTLHTHPSVFAFDYCLARTLISEGVQPDALVGYSLGELAAWTIGGLISLEDVLDVVIETAQLIESCTEPAAMLAVLASPSLFDELADEFQGTELACRNYAENFVITGTRPGLERIHDELRGRAILSQLLPIRHGFHSRMLEPMKQPFLRMMSRVRFTGNPRRIFSACAAREIVDGDLTPEFCWEILRKPVDFWSTLLNVEAGGRRLYIDVGPSGTLAVFARNMLGRNALSRALTVVDQFGNDLRNLEKAKAEARRVNDGT